MTAAYRAAVRLHLGTSPDPAADEAAVRTYLAGRYPGIAPAKRATACDWAVADHAAANSMSVWTLAQLEKWGKG